MRRFNSVPLFSAAANHRAMRLNALFLLLCGAVATVHAACRLTRNDVERERRIFASGSPNQYRLLRRDSVPTGTRLQMLCPGSTRLAEQTTCGANGRFNPPLPIRNCGTVRATVQPISDRSCRYQAYSVGYRVNRQFLELYRTCYDRRGVRALFTTHFALPFSLVTRRPEIDFTTDGVISGADAATFRRENVFQRFRALLGANQQYIPNNRVNVISRGHLTPSADYLFLDNMRSTFKYINAVPQFQSINVGNWKRIENWVRRHVARFPAVTVITGARDVLRLRDTNNNWVQMYLSTNNRNPIPKWMYKIVRDSRASYVFLTYNNIYNAPEPFSGTCHRVGCPSGASFSSDISSGYTVCCNPSTFRV